ncbi:unnamed protein product, partial [Lepidochelys kempii]
MKILYLLFALFFLVAQSSAQDSDRSVSRIRRCFRLRGGCFLYRCPPGSRYIGRCSKRLLCCRCHGW